MLDADRNGNFQHRTTVRAACYVPIYLDAEVLKILKINVRGLLYSLLYNIRDGVLRHFFLRWHCAGNVVVVLRSLSESTPSPTSFLMIRLLRRRLHTYIKHDIHRSYCRRGHDRRQTNSKMGRKVPCMDGYGETMFVHSENVTIK